jgi:hypothetical protein
MKIIGIFACMLLIATALSATGTTNAPTLKYLMENHKFEPYPSIPTDSPSDIAIAIVGEITDVLDQNNLLAGAIQIGDKISGKYIYDSATPDGEPDPNIGEYIYTSTPYGIELKCSGFTFETDPNGVSFGILIINDMSYYTLDLFYAMSMNNTQLSNGLLVDGIAFGLFDYSGTAISSDDLPTTAPILTDWDDAMIMIIGSSPSNPYDFYMISANVTKATLSRSKTIVVEHTMHPILNWLFDRYPNLFPILRHLLGLF